MTAKLFEFFKSKIDPKERKFSLQEAEKNGLDGEQIKKRKDKLSAATNKLNYHIVAEKANEDLVNYEKTIETEEKRLAAFDNIISDIEAHHNMEELNQLIKNIDDGINNLISINKDYLDQLQIDKIDDLKTKFENNKNIIESRLSSDFEKFKQAA